MKVRAMMHSGTVGNTDVVSFVSVLKAQNILLIYIYIYIYKILLKVHFSQKQGYKEEFLYIFSFSSPVPTPASTVIHHLIQENLKFQSDSFKIPN